MAGCLFNIISQGIVSILQSHPKLLLRVFDGMCVPSGLPMWLSGKESACNTGDMGSTHESGRFPGVGNETTLFWPGKSQGQRSLVGYSPWGRKESDTSERLHFHFSLSCIGERNGNPLQCSCLENPRHGGAWWAAVYRVAQSRTRLKWLSSSIYIYILFFLFFSIMAFYRILTIGPCAIQ